MSKLNDNEFEYKFLDDELMDTIKENTLNIFPLIPVSQVIIGPSVSTMLDILKPQSLSALEESTKASNIFAVVAPKDASLEEFGVEQFREICTIVEIKNIVRMPTEALRVSINGIKRMRIEKVLCEKPCYMIRTSEIEESVYSEDDKIFTLLALLKEKFFYYQSLNGRGESYFQAKLETTSIEDSVNVILSSMSIKAEEYYNLIDCTNDTERIEACLKIVSSAILATEVEIDLENRMILNVSTEQKNRYLKEKKALINKELNESEDEDEFDSYRIAIENLPIEEAYKVKLFKELDKYSSTPQFSQESAVLQSYLDCVLDLPWEKEVSDAFDINKAQKILDKDHYGLEEVKKRIIEYLAVIKLTSSLKGPILCLVGPPGVGKTSIAKSIANAVGRKFTRISLGGMHDESEIRGHRKTYVGAMPGRIINGLRQIGARNPVFLLDEIDKISKDMRGDPASALLEVLDPEQNSTFTDTYVEIPYDLSDVMFITTANSLAGIPAPLLDRMEVIELSSYLPYEKLNIAKKHLVKKQMENNGVTKANITFTDKILSEVIDKYTRESGVRQLERLISKLCRKAALRVVMKDEGKLKLTSETLREYLGAKSHTYDVMKKEKLIGVVNGLAWTRVGGDTLQIEVATSKGKGKLSLTGNLGEVMKESAAIALGFLKANASKFGIDEDIWDKTDIHIHVPEGAVPKDGPSAGITITTALISVLTDKAVDQQIAMTGEITLTGRVLAIGGLREKLIAASRAGVKTVIIPKENKEDLFDVADKIKERLDIRFVGKIDEVIEVVFSENR